MVSPMAGVTVTLNTMMAMPTVAMVAVCPMPQKAPISAPASKRLVRLTMVATATT